MIAGFIAKNELKERRGVMLLVSKECQGQIAISWTKVENVDRSSDIVGFPYGIR